MQVVAGDVFDDAAASARFARRCPSSEDSGAEEEIA